MYQLWYRNSVAMFLSKKIIVLFVYILPVAPTLMLNVAQVFETFNPYSIFHFFEFSDQDWVISAECLRDMYRFLDGLRQDSLWAFKLYDASSYYSGGGFGSIKQRFHNPNLCRALQLEHKREIKKNRIDLKSNIVPFNVHIVVATYILEVAHSQGFKLEKIQQLICFPSSCSSTDLHKILQQPHFQPNRFVRNNTYWHHRIILDSYTVWHDNMFYILIIFFFVTFAACIAEIIVLKCRPPKHHGIFSKSNTFNFLFRPYKKTNILHYTKASLRNKSQELTLGFSTIDLPKIRNRSKNGLYMRLLEALSCQNVLYQLLNPADVSVLSGFMAIFGICLVYAHCAAEMSFMANNPNVLLDESHRLSYMVKYSCYFYDAYFLVSGFKLGIEFMRQRPKKKLHVAAHLKFVTKLVLQKLLSQMPSFLLTLMMSYLLDKYLHYNVALAIPSYDFKNCNHNHLARILFLDIFFPISSRCMPWTWYISLDMLFFGVSCILLLLSQVHFQYFAYIYAIIFHMSILAATLWHIKNNQLSLESSIDTNNELLKFNLAYDDNIFLFISPYLLGICIGYIMFQNNFNINVNHFILSVGWCACICMILFYLCAFDVVLTYLSPVMCAFLITLSHTIWTLILLWTVLTSATKYGDMFCNLFCFKGVQVLEKITPICLLVAPVVIRLLIFSADAPIYTTDLRTAVTSIGCLIFVYITSFLFYLFINGRFEAVIKILFSHSEM